MTWRRRKRSLVRGHTIYVLGSPPPRWKPVVDRSIPVDYVRGKREREGLIEDDWLPCENDELFHPDEVGDLAAAVAFLDEVLGNRSEVVGDDNDATESAADEESQS
jgi:hypothetical protein